MITLSNVNNFNRTLSFFGLSSDTKPTGIFVQDEVSRYSVTNGSVFVEIDTGDEYMFDDVSDTWVKIDGGGGGVKREIVNTLPTTNIDPDTIYLIADSDGSGDNTYIEYMYVNDAWEALGSYIPDIWGRGTGTNSAIFKGENNTATGANAIAEGSNSQATADAAHAEGAGTKASGVQSHAEGGGTEASGVASHAEGGGTIASGDTSHAEGGGTTASGDQSHSEGNGTVASGDTSHAEGGMTEASGAQSHSEGSGTKAGGNNSHAEGGGTEASGVQSHSEGGGTKASGNSSHAEGGGTKASGNFSHAEGLATEASGVQSHSEGGSTIASGVASHAEGGGTTASGAQAHVEGGATKASGDQSHAEGVTTEAKGNGSHAEGSMTTADGTYAHVEGQGAGKDSNGSYKPIFVNNTMYFPGAHNLASHAEGYETSAGEAGSSGSGQHSEGYHTVAIGDASHAEGTSTIASGLDSHAEGEMTKASGRGSHSEGGGTQASGADSHAEGGGTTASGQSSHTEGGGTTASGSFSHAEGGATKAIGSQSHSEGGSTIASGVASHAEGYLTTASGDYSHAEGYCTTANHASQHVFGEWNIEDGSSALGTERGNYIEIVGNGERPDDGSAIVRSNARTLDWNGNEWLAGNVSVEDVMLPLEDGSNTRTSLLDKLDAFDTDVTNLSEDITNLSTNITNVVAQQVEQMQIHEGQTVIDSTLTVQGAAADAKKTGDELTNLKSAIEQIEPGMSDDAKTALLACFRHTLWADDQGQSYYNALVAALYGEEYPKITATYAPGSHVVYDTDTLDSLKPYLTVQYYATSASPAVVVSDYTLSGTLEEGTSTITVTYNGCATSFTVEVATHNLYKLTVPRTFDGNAGSEIDTPLNLLATDRSFTILIAGYFDYSEVISMQRIMMERDSNNGIGLCAQIQSTNENHDRISIMNYDYDTWYEVSGRFTVGRHYFRMAMSHTGGTVLQYANLTFDGQLANHSETDYRYVGGSVPMVVGGAYSTTDGQIINHYQRFVGTLTDYRVLDYAMSNTEVDQYVTTV